MELCVSVQSIQLCVCVDVFQSLISVYMKDCRSPPDPEDVSGSDSDWSK